MLSEVILILSLAMAIVAFLYASVGHAGASGYIAVMSLASFAPETIRPIALIMNIAVAYVTTWHFWRAGHFSWKLFWPFAILAIPFAFIGGYIKLPTHVFHILVGCILLFSAYRFFTKQLSDDNTNEPKFQIALIVGAVLGLLSGLTGTGGGIFLTPLLLFMKWAKAKQAAAVSALFILLNSISGLLGNFASTKFIPDYIIYFLTAALIGGFVGSYFGSQKFSHAMIKKILACVLLVAGFKLVLS
jgi:uncharacterized protein